MKFGCKDIVEIELLHGGNTIYKSESLSSWIIEADYSRGVNVIKFTDALIEFDFLDNITKGTYHNKMLSLIAKTDIRSAEFGSDSGLLMSIANLKLINYILGHKSDEVMNPVLIFETPFTNEYSGSPSIIYKIVNKR